MNGITRDFCETFASRSPPTGIPNAKKKCHQCNVTRDVGDVVTTEASYSGFVLLLLLFTLVIAPSRTRAPQFHRGNRLQTRKIRSSKSRQSATALGGN